MVFYKTLYLFFAAVNALVVKLAALTPNYMEVALSERKYGTVMAQAVGIYVCYLGIGEKLPEASYLFLVTAVKPYNAPVLGLCFVHISVSNLSRLWISHSKKIGACAYYNGVSLSLLKPRKYLFFRVYPKTC